MKKFLKYAMYSTILTTVGLAAYCEKAKEITGEKRQALLVVAEPITDGILAGHNENNYAKYSEMFDEQMKNALSEKVFFQKQEIIHSKIGKYKSRSVANVLKQDQYEIILYSAEFEKESGVQVKVVLQKYGEKYLVSGLWFNSPKLRE